MAVDGTKATGHDNEGAGCQSVGYSGTRQLEYFRRCEVGSENGKGASERRTSMMLGSKLLGLVHLHRVIGRLSVRRQYRDQKRSSVAMDLARIKGL